MSQSPELEKINRDWKEKCIEADTMRAHYETLEKVYRATVAELSKALKEMTDEYASSMRDAGVTHYPEALAIVRRARAIIAKAEGSANV